MPFAAVYDDREKLKRLCADLGFSEEMKQQLLRAFDTLDVKTLEEAFSVIFSDTVPELVGRHMEILDKNLGAKISAPGLGGLAVYLLAALHTGEIYRQAGISQAVYLDTMKAFVRFSQEDKLRSGTIYFLRYAWSCRHLRSALFRIGALEYEIRILSSEEPPLNIAAPGNWVLSVHIPSDAVLDAVVLQTSYRQAEVFFRQYFPQKDFRCIYCDSWLLSEGLKGILKPTSKILSFQADYTITNVNSQDNGGIMWVFQTETQTYEALPENTSLQCGLKKKLLSGSAIGTARGYVKGFFDAADEL